MAKRKKPQSEYMRRKLLRKTPPKPKQPRKPKADKRSYRSKRKAWIAHFEGDLKSIMRQAAKAGAAEAIEHCANFWSVSDGYKKYIDFQVKSQAEALMAAVRTALRQELTRRKK